MTNLVPTHVGLHLFPDGQVELGTGAPGYRWHPAYSEVLEVGKIYPPQTRSQWQSQARRDGLKPHFHASEQDARMALQCETTWRELRELREVYGHDERAINRHSVRYYAWPTVGHFQLNKTLDGSPPFYELLELRHDPRTEPDSTYIPRTIPVSGERCWGDGLSWARAEKLAKDVIQKICNSQ